MPNHGSTLSPCWTPAPAVLRLCLTSSADGRCGAVKPSPPSKLQASPPVHWQMQCEPDETPFLIRYFLQGRLGRASAGLADPPSWSFGTMMLTTVTRSWPDSRQKLRGAAYVKSHCTALSILDGQTWRGLSEVSASWSLDPSASSRHRRPGPRWALDV